MEYSNIDIFFSAACNMNCQYCYIQKDKEYMHRYNEKIIESIENGEFVKNIVNNFSNEQIKYIYSIGLWGAEPTINSRKFKILFKDLLNAFPNLENIMFSTNSYLGWDRIKDFVFGVEEELIENPRKFRLELQFSLDGPEWINENSRLKGCTQHTLDTIYSLCQNVPEDLHYHIEITTKPTVDAFYMEKMVENPDLIQEYFDFFTELQNKAEEYLKGNKHVTPNLLGSPTVVDPGFHTVSDGKIFAKWVNTLRTHKFNNEILFTQPFKFVKISDSREDDFNYITQPKSFTCGAGKGSIAMNHEGKVFNCHRFFRNSYLEDIQQPAIQAYTTLGAESFAVDYDRFKYVSSLPHEYIDSFRQYLNVMAIPMAKYKQIDSKYYDSEMARSWLFAFIAGVFCHLGQGEETQEVFFYTPSYLRYFGNGGVDELIKYGYEKGILKKI